MTVEPKEFQLDTISELEERFALAQDLAGKTPTALLLNAPTGSGKTFMATALFDALLAGSDISSADPDLVFVWLTDQPELNKQTHDKVAATSGALAKTDLIIIGPDFDAEVLQRGKLYFLNTQKLGAATSYVKHGDDRVFTLWETLTNTIEVAPTRFVLVLDEAHRGARGKDATEAETIMQKFMMGSEVLPQVPLVFGISATPGRFVDLCNETKRPLLRVDVDPDRVRESGLLKEFVDLYHPDEAQPSHVTMLQEAIKAWESYKKQWAAYEDDENEAVPDAVLVVQVEDAKTGSKGYSETDLPTVVGTLAKAVTSEPGDTRWIAHAFQDQTDLVIGGYTVRYLAPSDIDRDPEVQVVLFKTSLNTGWDCPRAETMVSFRSAKDETNIAQLVGRMVRAPLARRVDANEHLNTVALYLPYYDRKTVEKVISRLSMDPVNVPPARIREGKTAITLKQRPGSEACFEVFQQLPTYLIPRSRAMKPITRLAKLAALLGELGLIDEPVKTYRHKLVGILLSERKRLAEAAEFKKVIDEAAVLDVRRRRLDYAAASPDGNEVEPADLAVRAVIADQNIEDLYAESGRVLGEGLHKEYLRVRFRDDVDARAAKLELHALVSTNGVVTKLRSAAEETVEAWIDAHKAAVRGADEKYRQALRGIEGSGEDPTLTTIEPQPLIEGTLDGDSWPKHLYVDEAEKYYDTFISSWERRVLEKELPKEEIVGWIRNPSRKPWSLCIPRREGTKWAGVYPDFIFFRKTAGGILADIVDPHLLADPHAPSRAAAIANFAQKHFAQFGRIELVIYETPKDEAGKRLNLVNASTRGKVAEVKTHDHLRQLFDG